MRGNPEAHYMIAPSTLDAALARLAAEPGVWTPIAGGTELMVAHAAGRLSTSNLMSLWGLGELRFLREEGEWLSIGAGSTFADLRASRVVVERLPLLARAAGWIGSIANQSRATIGGNLVNGSPAADSSPALLAYDAEVELISARGRRRVAYAEFHAGYKANVLAKDELLYAVHLPLRWSGHRQYLRKVGTRRSMAISKVALACTMLLDGDGVRETRIGAASLAPFPARLFATEKTLVGKPLTAASIAEAVRALIAEARPIDDIRSTAQYRKRVAANLLEEFLQTSLQVIHGKEAQA